MLLALHPIVPRKRHVGMSATRILLVEDSPIWRTILKTHIRLALPDSDLQDAAKFLTRLRLRPTSLVTIEDDHSG
jgi:hypothetical protein